MQNGLKITRRNIMLKIMRLNLSTKLILCFVILSIAIICATVGPALYLFSDTMQKVNQDRALQGMAGLNTILETYKRDATNYGSVLATNPVVISAIESKNTAVVLSVLQPLVNEAKLDFATITDKRGVVIARTHAPDKKGDVVTNQANIQQALQGTAFAAIEPGTEVKLAARAGIPVKNATGELVGVISVGYNVAKNEAVDQAKAMFGTDTTLFLGDVRVSTTITKDGQRVVGTKLNETIAAKVLQEGQRYVGEADILGTSYVTTYMPLLGADNKPIGVIFAGQKVSEANEARNKLLLIIAGILGAVLLCVILLAVAIANRIVKPIKSLVQSVGLVASGDLTQQVHVTSSDEIGILAADFNKMVGRLRSLITKVNNLAQSVAASSEELTASADQSAQAANQVAISIADVADGTGRQLNAVNVTSAIVERISAGIEDVAANFNSVTASSEETSRAAQNGGQAIETADGQMNMIEAIVAETSSKVSKLGDRSKEIGQIVDTISAIAGQTNLLALNAAIEAARAGDAGRGFAVVAEEVRKLAEQSQAATKQITALIAEIQSETDEAVISIHEGTKQVALGSQVVTQAGESFNSIAGSVEKVTSQIKGISMAIQQMATGSQQIVLSVREIEEISKGTAGEMQTVSAATEEQSASMQEVASAGQALARMAEELQSAITVFKV